MSLDYNIFLELAVIPLDIVLCAFLVIRYKNPTKINIAFQRFAFLIMFADTTDVLTAVVTSAHDRVPNPVHYFFNISDSLLAAFASFAYIYYVYAYVEMDRQELKLRNHINHLLLLIDCILLLTNPLTGWVFVYDAQGNYIHHGLFTLVAYGFPLLFFIMGSFFLLRHREKYKRRQVITLVVAMIIMFVLYAIQMLFFDNFLITFFLASIGVLIIFLSLETPDYVELMKTMAELEESRKQAKEAAEAAIAAGKAKSSFLAQMSHEIRTPINAVLGMNEMILREADNDEIMDYALNIQAAGKNLLTIINGILDFSKIEDGKMEICEAGYDTSSIINNLVNSIQDRAKGKGLEFITDIDETLPAKLYGDDVRLTQIIMNLLTNAVKYTEQGSVCLHMRAGEKERNGIFLDVAVEDTGIGIKKEDMGKLFEAFERLDEKRNRTIEGTGLGMSIVTKLLSMMDSELKVESEYGKGSVFSFRLWQAVVNSEPIGNYSERASKAMKQGEREKYLYAPDAKILVVDDNAMNLKVAKNLMKLNGIVPDLASSGMEAIEQIREKKYDIVFLDHMMPKMDGIETLEKLRTENLLKKGTTMIALTANAIAGAKERYLKAGFEDYLSKPIEIEKLEEILQKHLPNNMIEWRKKEKRTAGKTPIPEISTRAEEKTNANPNALVKKNMQKQQIFEFMPEDLKPEDLKPEDLKPEEKTGTKTIEKLEQLGIHVKDGLMLCGGDKPFYLEMLGDYVESFAAKNQEMQTRFKEKNWQEYQISIHALKNTSKTLGAIDTYALAKELEDAAENKEEPFLLEHHEAFRKHYEAMVKNIKDVLEH